MINGLIYVVKILAIVIIAFAAFSVLKKYVFSKFKVNKWVIIIAAVVVIILPLVLMSAIGLQMNSVISTIQSGLIVLLTLWFMDIMGWGPKTAPASSNAKKNKAKYATTSVIKSKAKPNRLKYTDMEVIDIKDIKKKKKK